jgi:hypothetical protein
MLAPIFGNIKTFLPTNYQEGSGLALFIRNAVNAFFFAAGLAAFAFLLMGGFRYLTASGDTKATEAAMRMITNAVIGLAIIVATYGATRILATIFGVDIFHPVFKGP